MPGASMSVYTQNLQLVVSEVTMCLLVVFLVSLHVTNGHDSIPQIKGANCKYHGTAEFGLPVEVDNIGGNVSPISPSGLASSGQYEDVLYFVSDNGDNKIYAVNAADAQIIGSITVTDATNVDWEDLTVARCPSGSTDFCIYIHDAGSSGPGPAHKIYIVKEEIDPATDVSKAALQIIDYTFQPGNTGVSSNSIFVDCDSRIHFFSMAPNGKGTRIYQIQNIQGVDTAVGVLQLDLPTSNNGPSAVSLSADCCEMLIKMEDRVYYLTYNDGKIDKEQLQILPCTPHNEEEAIAWNLRQNGYYITSESAPFMLKFSRRDTDVPESKFSFGTVLGNIGNGDFHNLAGIASSRDHKGFIYAVSDIGGTSNDVLIVQTCHAQNVGKILTGIAGNDVEDIAVGPCIAPLGVGKCIYMNDGSKGSLANPLYKIYVFKEPENMFATTTLTLGAENTLTYTGVTGDVHATMIACDGEIYVMGFAAVGATFDIYKLTLVSGTTYSAVSIATIQNPSANMGPEAADISPCCDEILLKFEDCIYHYKLVDDDVVAAFQGEPCLLPYIPDHDGTSITFSDDCNSYFTTSDDAVPSPLKKYDRLQCCEKPIIH